MNKWLWSLLCVTLLGAAACSDDDTEGDSGNPIPPALSTENLPDAGLKFLYSALTPHTFTMSVDAPWEITKTGGWVRRHPEQGRGGPEYPGHRHPDPEPGRGARRRIHHPRQQRQQPPSLPDGEEHPAFAGRLPGGRHRDNGARRTPAGIRSRRYGSGGLHRPRPSYDWTLTVENDTWLTVAPRAARPALRPKSPSRPRPTPPTNAASRSHDHGRRRRIRREHRRRDHRAGSGALHAQGHACRGTRLLQRRLPVDSRQLGEPLHQVRLAERIDRRHERQRVRPFDRRDERGRSGQGLHLHTLGICPLRRPCQAG